MTPRRASAKVWHHVNAEPGVYYVLTEDDMVKIGASTTSAKNRAKQTKGELLGICPCHDGEMALMVEACLHYIYRNHRVPGTEIFEIQDLDDLLEYDDPSSVVSSALREMQP